MSGQLERVEQVIDASGTAERIERLLPTGVRPRQLRARTLLIGMTLALLDHRDAHLVWVHEALTSLPEADQRRLAVIADWTGGPHQLTYRQVEYTYRLINTKLSKDKPDGSPSPALADTLDRLLEASVQVLGEGATSSYAVDWSDLESWSRPPPKQPANHGDQATAGGESNTPTDEHQPDPQHTTKPATPAADCADPEAAWGHRNPNHPGKNEMFFGYYLQTVTAVRDEHGPEVPELARRMQLTSCQHDPPAQIVPVIQRMHHDAIPIGDLLADSGYAYRRPEHWALPIRALGTQLVQDLHPNDRGPHGTHQGATCANGNLYCPATPTTLLQLSPLARAASSEQTAAHDRHCDELSRYKLSPITGYDQDGYRRVICPAAQGKLRCPHRPASLTLSHEHPTILTPPEHPPVCCTQKTITVPPAVNAKTAQKHDYPSPQHRHSYNRRTAAERTFATLTNRATTDISRGWCRLMGLAPIALFTATALIARNIRTAEALQARQAENKRRAANGLPPKQRKRRRHTTEHLTRAANAPP